MPLTPRSSDEHVSVRGADPYVDALPPEKVRLQHARKRAARGSQAHAVCFCVRVWTDAQPLACTKP